MKLYICWGTFPSPRPGGHPCANAYHALKDAGYEPELIKSYGLGPLPALTKGRKDVQKMTGQKWVPVLVTDDDEVIQDSKAIVQWAKDHPKAAPASAAKG